MPDRSADFRALHQTVRDDKKPAERKPNKLPDTPFAEPLRVVVASVRRTLLESRERVAQALTTIDDYTSTPDARGAAADGLVLSDASLLAAASATQQLVTAVQAADDKLAKRFRGSNVGRQQLEHTYNALQTMAALVSQQRIAVALAREEVDRHRTMLVRWQKAGVLVAPQPAPAAVVAAPAVTAKAAKKAAPPEGTAAATASRLSALKASAMTQVKSIAQTTKHNVAALSERASRAAGPAQASAQTAQRFQAAAARYDEDVDKADTQWRGELAQEHAELVERQNLTASKAAKQVEGAVRELSVLTSILNEQVTLQSEKLELVERNTRDTQSNLQGAAEQLLQPLQQTWTAKRILAAALWVSMVLMLAADWLVR